MVFWALLKVTRIMESDLERDGAILLAPVHVLFLHHRGSVILRGNGFLIEQLLDLLLGQGFLRKILRPVHHVQKMVDHGSTGNCNGNHGCQDQAQHDAHDHHKYPGAAGFFLFHSIITPNSLLLPIIADQAANIY